MKKTVLAIVMAVLAGGKSMAQHAVSGKVTDKGSNEPIPGVVIKLNQDAGAVSTDAAGNFTLKNVRPGKNTLRLSMTGYQPLLQEVDVNGEVTLQISMEKRTIQTDEVIIQSIRADEKSGATYELLNADDLRKNNLGQDLPYLLNFTPSAVVTSDAGTGVGYTGLRIRGSDQTRINTTINGIPVNDAESHGVFWVDLPDIASSVETIQIQRGVGTSSNGAGAFGGSMNIQTSTLQKDPGAEVNLSYGSFNTFKRNIKMTTGLINNRWAIDGRLSQITSDGYIDRATANLKSYYASAARYGEKSILKFTHFSGNEKTYQAWGGVPEALLATNRTFNPYTYSDETDNYRQDYYQLHYSYSLSDRWNANAAGFFTKGKGYYEQYKTSQDLAAYSIAPIELTGDTITSSDLIRRLWLDNNYYGGIFSLNYDNGSNLKFTLGGGVNQYDGRHYSEVIWARFAGASEIRHRYSMDDALKTDGSIYAKTTWDITGRLSVFGDVQARQIDYRFTGFDRNLNNVAQQADMLFINPKTGITYMLNPKARLYTSFSRANREPNRNDFTSSSASSRPKSEELNNVEAGMRFGGQKLKFNANYYLMQYRNELVLTGMINDVGAYVRTNVPQSMRTGVELSWSASLHQKIQWTANITLSRNRVKNYTEYMDDYDNGGQVTVNYSGTPLAFSPDIIAGSELQYSPLNFLSIALLTKYVGKQYMDNTGNESRTLDAYLLNDLRLIYTLRSKNGQQLDITLTGNNLLDELYENNGYTFSYVFGGQTVTENYYYPQAGRNYMAGIRLKF